MFRRPPRSRLTRRLGLAAGLAAALTGIAIVAGGEDPASDVGATAWAVTSATPRSLTVPSQGLAIAAAVLGSGRAPGLSARVKKSLKLL